MLDFGAYTLLMITLGLSAYTALRLYVLRSRVGKESRKSFEIAMRLQEDWERFFSRENEERDRLNERYERFESATRDRVERFEKLATGTRERLIKLEQYLKEFFEVELKAVFDSFDKTVASILEEMKSELLRGVERIEEIQAVVDSKSFAQDRILDGEGSVYRLIADTSDSSPEPSQIEVSVDTEPVETAPDNSDDDRGKEPPFHLEADEAE